MNTATQVGRQASETTDAGRGTAITAFDFYGDRLEVIHDTASGEVWVSVKRVCEALGVDHDAQRVKLRAAAWAVTVLIAATGPDGKNYETFCVDLRRLPMWLATISPSRVAERARPKLVLFQNECAQALEAHFLGSRTPAAPALDSRVVDVLASVADGQRALSEAVHQQGTLILTFAQRLEALEQGSRGSITRYELAGIRSQVAFITRGRVAAGLSRSQPSARRWVYNRLGAIAGWLGTGRAWALLPAGKLPEVLAELDALRREVDASIGALMANGRQLVLPLHASNDTKKLAN